MANLIKNKPIKKINDLDSVGLLNKRRTINKSLKTLYINAIKFAINNHRPYSHIRQNYREVFKAFMLKKYGKIVAFTPVNQIKNQVNALYESF